MSVCGLLFAALAGANSWTLYVKPDRVAQGGTLGIWTTAQARTCALTIRLGGQSYNYRLKRAGDRFSLSQGTALGHGRVTVHCEGLVASETITVIRRPRTHSAPSATEPQSNPPPVSPASQSTPVTVYNVCHLDPGLGTQHDLDPDVNGQIWPTVAWLDSSGQIAILAASTDGDSAVDIAVIPTAANPNVVAYFARCSWSNWITVAQWEQDQQQSGVSAAQAGSLAYLQEVMPENSSLASTDLPWVTPQVGWSQCPADPYSECDYELQPDDDD
jgi:hypothetical protein